MGSNRILSEDTPIYINRNECNNDNQEMSIWGLNVMAWYADILKFIIVTEIFCILINVLLNFVPCDTVDCVIIGKGTGVALNNKQKQ